MPCLLLLCQMVVARCPNAAYQNNKIKDKTRRLEVSTASCLQLASNWLGFLGAYAR